MRVALCRCFLAHAAELVSSRLRSSAAQESSLPLCVLVRSSPSQEWLCKDFPSWYRNHVESSLCFDTRSAFVLTVDDLDGIDHFLHLSFAGAWLTTLGDCTTFQCTRRQLPFFPSSTLVRHRVTFWQRSRGTRRGRDLLIGSLDGIILALCLLLDVQRFDDPSLCAVTLERALALSFDAAFSYARAHSHQASDSPVACVDEHRHREDAWSAKVASYLSERSVDVWRSRPPTILRPPLFSDYALLGRQLGYEYVGERLTPDVVDANTIPASILSSKTVWLPQDKVSEGAASTSAVDCSLYALHMQL